MSPNIEWMEYSNFHNAYAEWCQALDELCDHYLDIRFYDVKDYGDFDTHDAFFVQHARPEEFFVGAVVPFMQNEHGFDWIHAHIAEKVMWGITTPGPMEP